MLKLVDRSNRTREHVVLRSMFEERKRVFVDELGWDLPLLAGLYEVDQFDDGHATYLIVADRDDRHLASARLLQTTRVSSIETLYPDLVDGGAPKGRDVVEITRLFLSCREDSDRYQEVRDLLLAGLVNFAVQAGVQTYTTVAYPEHRSFIANLGWTCRQLGQPLSHAGRQAIALRIETDGATLKPADSH
ncbi:MAG: GNAT family N-acetyltransferase [Sphingopyxis sp.]|nr:GNAT family N-acetyltransferase [Sphingopyxis sp.]